MGDRKLISVITPCDTNMLTYTEDERVSGAEMGLFSSQFAFLSCFGTIGSLADTRCGFPAEILLHQTVTQYCANTRQCYHSQLQPVRLFRARICPRTRQRFNAHACGFFTWGNWKHGAEKSHAELSWRLSKNDDRLWAQAFLYTRATGALHTIYSADLHVWPREDCESSDPGSARLVQNVHSGRSSPLSHPVFLHLLLLDSELTNAFKSPFRCI